MIEAKITNLLAYFGRFKNESYPASAMVYGHSRKVAEQVQVLEKAQYPLLHIERPFVITDDNNSSDQKEFFICTINAFDKYLTDGTTDENDMSEILAEDRTLAMLQDLQKRLNHDAGEGLIEFELDGNEKNPIQDNYVQYHTGWQMVVKIGLSAAGRLC
jgi:hypothetical protein